MMTTFETMLEKVQSALAEVTPALNSEMPPQATALLTDHGNVYVAVCRDVFGSDCSYDSLLAMLKAKGETKILKMVTMWQGGFLEISSMNFRESIYEMNKENIKTEILVQGQFQPFVKKMINTLYPSVTLELLKDNYKDWTNAKRALDEMEKHIEQHGMYGVGLSDVLRAAAPEIWEDIYG